MENLRIEIYIPKIKPFPCLKSFYDFLMREFGGMTVFGGFSETNKRAITGLWRNNHGKTFTDDIMLILIYAKRDKLEVNTILDFELNQIGIRLRQQSMMYVINNEAFFVEVK